MYTLVHERFVCIQGAIYTDSATLYHGYSHWPLHPRQIAEGVAKSFQGGYLSHFCALYASMPY